MYKKEGKEKEGEKKRDQRSDIGRIRIKKGANEELREETDE